MLLHTLCAIAINPEIRTNDKSVLVKIVASTSLVLFLIGCTGKAPDRSFEPRKLSEFQFERTQKRVERGKYLVSIAQCFDCHSPIDSILSLPLQGKEGSGDIIDSVGRLIAPNITPDIETGAGSWTDDMFVRAIREGIGHDGRPLHSAMRSEYFAVLTDEDVASIVVYLRTVSPVRHDLPVIVRPKDQLGFRDEIGVDSALIQNNNDTIARGAYLVRIAFCEHCHSPMDSIGRRKTGLRFAGGTIGIHDSLHPIVSKNITSDPSGISYYDEDLFIQTLKTGRVGGVRTLNPWMPWPYLRNMEDDDLRAVFRYLQHQPPVRHNVDNSEPPQQCRLCGTTHGLGNLN